jgi:DNA polymerase/3'-5' exonuclease PolX
MKKIINNDLETLHSSNQNLLLEFRKLIKIYEYIYKKTTDPKEKIVYKHKIIRLKNSAKQIRLFPDPIMNTSQIKDLPGVGKGTIARVNEYLENHKLMDVEDFCNQNNCDIILHNKNPSLIYEDLISILGVGEKLANKLIRDHNITSIKQLQKLVNENKVTIPDTVKIGLRYFGKIKNNIPRSEITQTREYIYDIFEKLDTKLVFDVCGSFRRKKLTSNDLDLLVTSYDLNMNESDEKSQKILKKIIDVFYKNNFLIESLTGSDSTTRFMGFYKYKNNPIRKIDIRLVPIQSFFPAYLYFTGSYEFNERMRGIAKRQGYKLNEYGLYKNDKFIQVYSEEDVFDILGMKYLLPNERI